MDRDPFWFQTVDGNRFYPFSPLQKDFDINVIASVLSNLCRFGGHCTEFYSVAQHSVLVSWDLKFRGLPGLALAGLLHDAAEAYIGDAISPIKDRLLVRASEGMRQISEVESAIQGRINNAMAVPHVGAVSSCRIKESDMRLLAAERRDLMVPTDDRWECLGNIGPPDWLTQITPEPPAEARETFLARYREIKLAEATYPSWETIARQANGATQ